MFKTINKLSYGAKNTTIYGLNSVSYPYLDNYGAVLNIQGFPGSITFYNNRVERNLAYIRETRVSLPSQKIEPENLANFEDSVYG
jgi:hypothetical protein